MKKAVLIAALSLVAGIASADFAITWASVSNPIWEDGGDINGPYLANGNLIQLIWTQDAQDAAESKALEGGGLASGEVLLQTLSTAFDYGMWQSAEAPAIYTLSDGYVFTRVFNSAEAAFGEWYFDSDNISVADNQYDSSNPQSIYTDDIIGSGGVGISANGTQVVPEPATIGLMGIAGLGMFLARRKTRR